MVSILAMAKVLAFAAVVNAHHLVSNFYVDGVNQGPGTCMRVPPSTTPLTDITHANMACNVGGGKKVDITCAVNAGSEITVQWRTWPDGSNDQKIDVSHQGPCSVYMKRMQGNDSVGTAAGGGWFKVWHDGFGDGKFCTERLRANDNKMKFKIPKDLAGGHYLIRFEHIALHQAQEINKAQWYVGCAQIFLYSTGGNAIPKNTCSIPGHVKANHPGVLFNYWSNMTPQNYAIPGPTPYKPTNAGGGKPIKKSFNPHPKYKECLVKNGNWCAVSVPGFENEATCWLSAGECWKQLNACYDNAGVTGHKGCTLYEAWCTHYQNHCHKCAPYNCKGTFPAPKITKRHIHAKRHARPGARL